MSDERPLRVSLCHFFGASSFASFWLLLPIGFSLPLCSALFRHLTKRKSGNFEQNELWLISCAATLRNNFFRITPKTYKTNVEGTWRETLSTVENNHKSIQNRSAINSQGERNNYARRGGWISGSSAVVRSRNVNQLGNGHEQASRTLSTTDKLEKTNKSGV